MTGPEPEPSLPMELATPEAVTVARAKLSEGWCPICGTPFRQRDVIAAERGDGLLRCRTGYSYEAVQVEVEQAATWHASRGAVEANQ